MTFIEDSNYTVNASSTGEVVPISRNNADAKRTAAILHPDPDTWRRNAPRPAITIFTSVEKVAKEYWLENGKLKKKAAAQIITGAAQRVSFKDLAEFRELVGGLADKQAIGHGVTSEERVQLVTKKKQSNGSIARTRENFKYADGAPGIVMLDYDPRSDSDMRYGWRDLDEIFCKVFKPFRAAARYWRPSSTAYIYAPDGRELVGPGGWRCYLIAENAADIPDIGAALYQALWAAGHGYIFVSESGALHDRSLVDASVWQPERLDFAGPPVFRDGLTRRLPDDAEMLIDGGMISADGLARLDMKEWRKSNKKLKAAKEAIRPAAEKKERVYVEKRVASLKARGVEVDEKTVRRAIQKKVLLPHDTLYPENGACITVAEIMADPERWHHERFADPHEPEYEGGDKRIAVAFLTDGKPSLYSHAHGGQRYALVAGADKQRDMFAPVEVWDWPAVTAVDTPYTNDSRNVKAVLDAAGVQLRYDVFTGKEIATWQGQDVVLDDGVYQRFWLMLQGSELRATKKFAYEAISALARETTFDSAVDFFNSLPKWDGITRAETILIDELGAEDTAYTRGATRLFFASLVRRGMGIESKCDEFVILRGPQRLGKSSLFKWLIGEDLFQENLKMGHSIRELLELTLGKLIVEMAELSGMRKTDRDDVKNFFSRTFDEFSLKHEKHATRRKRRFTFVGTANNEGPIANMLEEDRRFLIIPVTKRADLNRIKRDRLQILAEAIEIEKAYGPILEISDELRPAACSARAKVVARPEYEEVLEEAFGNIVSAKITASYVYAFLGLRDLTAIGRYTKSTGGGIKSIMERLGWRYAQLRRVSDDKSLRVWAFEKNAGAGWIRPLWTQGVQAAPEIGPDLEFNTIANGIDPEWTPAYT